MRSVLRKALVSHGRLPVLLPSFRATAFTSLAGEASAEVPSPSPSPTTAFTFLADDTSTEVRASPSPASKSMQSNQQADKDLDVIRKSIAYGIHRNDPVKVLNAFNGAHDLKLVNKLTMQEFVDVLWACSVISDDRNQAAYVVYKQLKSSGDMLNVEMLSKMLEICNQRGGR